MKKLALTVLTLTFFLFTSVFAQQSEAEKLYLEAMTTQDVAKRAELLKQFIDKYGGQGSKYEKFAYANLCLLPYESKTPQKTIEYGEKALSIGGLDSLTKCQVYITLADVYIKKKQNLDKAVNYAQQVIEISKANQNKEESSVPPKKLKQLEGAGYFTKAQAQKKAENYSEALDSYINSFNILKSKEILNKIKSLGKTLYDAKSFSLAEKAFQVTSQNLDDFASCAFYAKTLYRNKKLDQALKYFKKAYSKKKSGELAYNIGIILAKKTEADPSSADKAVRYLLEASFLSKTHSEKAMSLAERLYFNTHKELQYNQTVKELNRRSKKVEELTKKFNETYGDKNEEDLSESEKKEMQSLREQITAQEKAIEKLKEKQKEALEKWKEVIKETKERLGIS